jgi:hypothetical protein
MTPQGSSGVEGLGKGWERKHLSQSCRHHLTVSHSTIREILLDIYFNTYSLLCK